MPLIFCVVFLLLLLVVVVVVVVVVMVVVVRLAETGSETSGGTGETGQDWWQDR